MRICYVSHSSSHFTRPYVDHFARRGHDVHLISLLGPTLQGVTVHHPIGPDPGLFGRKLLYLKALPSIARLLARLQPDVVHANWVVSNGFAAAWSGRHPLVLSARGGDLHDLWRPERQAVLRYALKRADLVNPVSVAFEAPLRRLGVPKERLLTLTQGVESSRFRTTRAAPREGPVRLIATRTLAPHYDSATIVRALARLQGRGVPFRFTFAAGGPERGRLGRLVRRLSLDGQVEFLGGYDHDRLPALLAASDVYVSASRSDGASMSLLEAMASGLFPVVTDEPGNREWLEGTGDSLMFAAGDDKGLAAQLERAIADAALRAAAAALNLRTVETRAERARNLDRLGEAYERLAGAPRAESHAPRHRSSVSR